MHEICSWTRANEQASAEEGLGDLHALLLHAVVNVASFKRPEEEQIEIGHKTHWGGTNTAQKSQNQNTQETRGLHAASCPRDDTKQLWPQHSGTYLGSLRGHEHKEDWC